MVARQIELDLARLAFRLLQREDIGAEMVEHVHEIFTENSADAVHIP